METTQILEPHDRRAAGFRVAAGTHPGRKRQLNQDSVLALARPLGRLRRSALLVVADGMGGHKAGDVASRLAVKSLHESLGWLIDAPSTLPSPTAAARAAGLPPGRPIGADARVYLNLQMRLAVARANDAIQRYARANAELAGNLGTTLTCALLVDQTALIANIGDSRAYLWRNGRLRRLTEDHSYVGLLVKRGQLQEHAVYDHPQRHLVTRSLGSNARVEPDLVAVDLLPGDRLLLCSDGLWETLRDGVQIGRLLQANPLEAAVAELIDHANAVGGADNISVVLGEVVALA